MSVVNGRQYGDIRRDHIERYKFAARFVMGEVVDLGCGTGYGSRIMAAENYGIRVTAYDKDLGGCTEAERVSYRETDLQIPPPINGDWAVCFEVIEHLADPHPLLKLLRTRHLICSVPNQDKLPFDQVRHSYHHRHYTRAEFMALLEACGWRPQQSWTQTGKESRVTQEMDGMFLIAVCSR